MGNLCGRHRTKTKPSAGTCIEPQILQFHVYIHLFSRFHSDLIVMNPLFDIFFHDDYSNELSTFMCGLCKFKRINRLAGSNHHFTV